MEGSLNVTTEPLRQTVSRSWGLFTALAFLMLGNGLLSTLLGIRSELEGFATATTGVVLAFYFVGFLAGSQVVPTLVTRVGHVRAFAGLASLASVSALVHAAAVDPAVWASMRFITGLCQAGLYVVAESWLNELATNHNRGRLLSAYMVVVMGGMAAGQFLVTVADPAGFVPFIIASIMTSLAVVPISLSIGTAPRTQPQPKLNFAAVWRAAPLGLVGGLGTGLSNGAFISIGPIYALRVGMSASRLALFMSVALVGSVVLQFPIGAASDRMHRRRAILLAAMLAALMAGLATTVDTLGPLILILAFFFGGLSFPLYSLSLSHINDVLPTGQRVTASSVFVFVTGVGAIIGPISASLAVHAVGPVGLWWVLVIVNVAIGMFALFRISVREPMPIADQRKYTLSPSRASAVVARLAFRAGRKHEQNRTTSERGDHL